MKLPSLKSQLIIFLGLFALYLSLKDKDAIFLLAATLAVVSAMTADLVFAYIKTGKPLITVSSAISGLIIGFLLSSNQPLGVFPVASLLAIGSKHVLCIHKKHIFNPAACGVFLSIILFGADTQWKGTYLWYILVPFGLYFITKIRKLEVLGGYAFTALILFGVQAYLQKAPLLGIFGYFGYFFIFIMLIEPKTTPIKPLAKFIFGMAVAVLIFIFTEAGVKFDAELGALLVLNLSVPLYYAARKPRPFRAGDEGGFSIPPLGTPKGL